VKNRRVNSRIVTSGSVVSSPASRSHRLIARSMTWSTGSLQHRPFDLWLNLLTVWQTMAPVNCPYVFMDHERWSHYRERVDRGNWNARDLVNNVLRRFKTLCRRAGVPEFTIHDLRRSCITNWARKLPIHVTQHLAGHADINTTQKYYLSVQKEDVAKAKRLQKSLLGDLKPVATDPKLTHNGRKRDFPKRKQFASPPEMHEL